jgi:hypothetical protein
MTKIAYQSERYRLRRHFKSIERRLRTSNNKAKPESLNQQRVRHLGCLHEYWVLGQFPRNYDHLDQPIPCFIDRNACVCAVAHLLIASGYSELAHQIANQTNNAYITEMAFPALNDWVTQSGLTLHELALIQPTYIFCELPDSYINSPPPIIQDVDRNVNPGTSPSPKIFFPLSPSMREAVIWRQRDLNSEKWARRRRGDGNGCATPITPPKIYLYQGADSFNPELTTSAYPTFFIHVGKPRVDSQKMLSVEFTLWDKNQQQKIYSTTFVPSNTSSGIVAFNLPPGVSQPLEVGKRYYWRLVVLDNPTDDSTALFVEGKIERIELSPSVSKQLREASSLEKAALYAKAGIWYDTIAILAGLRCSQPNNLAVAVEWEGLLRSVGLDDIAREPLLICYPPV